MSTWRESAGRSRGRDGYQFGDFTRSIMSRLSGSAVAAGEDERQPVTPTDTEQRDREQLEAELLRARAEMDAQRARELVTTCAAASISVRDGVPSAEVSDDPPTESGASTRLERTDVPLAEVGVECPAAGACPILEGARWPDPDPAVGRAGIVADDVTRMNATHVCRIVYPRCEEDVRAALAAAREAGVRVSMRGTQHCMGGHTLAPGGVVLDMSRMNEVWYEPETTLVHTGPGTTWSELILALNAHARSPRTMQSYSSFSVGGTVAVNAHGITTDHCCHESVHSFRLMLWDGRVVECARGAAGEAGELFGLAIGGFGMFGVMTRLALRTELNTHLHLETLHCSVPEFVRVYEGVLAAEDVEIKLARVDVSNMGSIQLFVFRNALAPGQGTVSELPLQPRCMSPAAQVLYKWIVPSAAPLRAALERATGRAMDWSGRNERNLLMYESAEPLARLYSLFFDVDDSFVLQEYFMPLHALQAWLEQAADVLQRGGAAMVQGPVGERPDVHLLNITIRFVKADDVTTLAYSQSAEGMVACVLYYRIRRTSHADAALGELHDALVRATLRLGGVFYLPYRHHYSDEQLRAAYPRFPEFCERKRHFDPHYLFDSLWYRRYGAPLHEGAVGEGSPIPYAAPSTGLTSIPATFRMQNLLSHALAHEREQDRVSMSDTGARAWSLAHVPEKREDSYRRLHASAHLRRLFYEGFLTRIFNVESALTLRNCIARALWNTQNTTDILVYSALVEALQTEQSHAALRAYRSVSLLRSQKRELTRQMAAIIDRLGRMGSLSGYVSIGDHGKVVGLVRDVLAVRGQCYVVHDQLPAQRLGGSAADDMPAILERGSIAPVGKPVRIDYRRPGRIPMPDECVDLVTMNQGLHHVPQAQLGAFLREIRRILRPGGLFIVREHDGRGALIPLLDLAHSVFNAVTGVSVHEETTEIRAFRTIQGWREVLTQHGFQDSMVYDMEPGDPTEDEMMCFIKPSDADDTSAAEGDAPRVLRAAGSAQASEESRTDTPHVAETRAQSWAGGQTQSSPLVSTLNAFVDSAPAAVIEAARALLDSAVAALTALRRVFSADGELGRVFSQGQRFLWDEVVRRVVDPLVILFGSIRPHLDSARMRTGKLEVVPPELFLALQALLEKAESGRGSPAEKMAAAFVKDVQGMFAPTRTGTGAGIPHGLAHSASPLTGRRDVDPSASGSSPGQSQGAGISLTGHSFSLAELDGAPLRDVVEAQLHRLLLAEPLLASPQAAARAAGLNRRVQSLLLAKLGAGPWTAPRLATALMPYLDRRTWSEMVVPMEEIMSAPGGAQPLSLEALTSPSANPWHRLLMAFLGSPRVQPTAFNRTLAATLGLKPFVTAWTAAQRLRALRSPTQHAHATAGASAGSGLGGSAESPFTPMTPTLSESTVTSMDLPSEVQRVLAAAVRLAFSSQDTHPDTAMLDKVLEETGLLPPAAAVPKAEYTLYKLPEWLQVEMVQIFGAFMEHTPWYRFPFMGMLRTYFSVLGQEFAVAARTHGPGRAVMSRAFVTDVIPGLVMASLLGQLQLLALPLRAAFGEEYSDTDAVSQQEHLVIAMNPVAASPATLDWAEIAPRAHVRIVAPGLWSVRVPSLKPFSHALVRMSRMLPHSAVLLRVSGHDCVQVRVALPQELDSMGQQRHQLAVSLRPGVSVLFAFTLPTEGAQARSRTHLALAVRTPQMFATLRWLEANGIEVVQAYDFW